MRIIPCPTCESFTLFLLLLMYRAIMLVERVVVVHRVMLAVNEYKLMFLKLYSLLLNIALRNRDLIIDNQNFIYLREKNVSLLYIK